jgi:hypothetical protein
MMFVLVDESSGGVYAVRDDDTIDRVVQIFVDKDDATRYYDMLVLSNYRKELVVTEVEEDSVKQNCKTYGYKYAIISTDDFVIPPPNSK